MAPEQRDSAWTTWVARRRGTPLAAVATAAGIALAGIAAYGPALSAGFVYDDHPLVEKGPDVHGPLVDIWVRPRSLDYWPVTWTSFWVESRLFGDDPAEMHASNVALHVLAALLVWRVLAALSVPGAGLAGLLFVLHPVGVESVAWIIERKNTLSAVLYLATALTWFKFEKGHRTRDGVASLTLFVLACLAKSSGILLPFVLLAIAVHRSGSVELRLRPWFGALFVAALALATTTIAFQWTRAMADDPPQLSTFTERVAGAASAWVFYAQKAFVPTGLAFVYPEWPLERGVLFYAPLVLLSSLGVALWMMRRSVNRPMLWALGYHALLVLPVLGLVDTTYSRISPVANQWQYLALIGPVAVVSAGIAFVASRVRLAVGVAIAAAVAATLGALSFHRATAFENDFTLWSAAAHDAPESTYAALMNNAELNRKGRRDEAARALSAFVERCRDPAARHRIRGVMLFDLGSYREATEELLTAHALRPTSLEIGIGGWLVDAGRCADAVNLLSATIESMPRSVQARYSLGMALICAGRAQDAVTLFRESNELLPGNEKLEAGLVAATLYAGSGARQR